MPQTTAYDMNGYNEIYRNRVAVILWTVRGSSAIKTERLFTISSSSWTCCLYGAFAMYVGDDDDDDYDEMMMRYHPCFEYILLVVSALM